MSVSERTGRWLLFISKAGCAPCSDLKAAFREEGELDAATVYSELSAGDVATRSFHLSCGAKTYPQVLMIVDDEVFDRQTGCPSNEAGVDVSRFMAFVRTSDKRRDS